MGLIESLRNIFFRKSATVETGFEENAAERLEITRFSIECAISLIAKIVSLAQFNFRRNSELIRAEDWYRWNFEPNRNQNKQEFIYELIRKEITEGEAVVVRTSNGMFVADSFQKETNGFGIDIYSNVEKDGDIFADNLTADDLYHFQYNDAKVYIYLAGVARQYAEMLATAEKKYKKNNADKGIFRLNAGVGGGEAAKQNEKDQSYGSQIAKFLNSDKSAVITLRKGMEYEELGKYHQSQSAEDIALLTKEIFARTAEAFHMSAALLMGTGEATATDDNINQTMRFCIRPFLDGLETEIVRKEIRLEGISQGIMLDVDETNCWRISPLKLADAIDKLAGSAGFSIDEIRTMFKYPALNTSWSRRHYLTKNYQPIELSGKED